MQLVDQILPPISKWDEVKLCVALPLLEAVLNSANRARKTYDSATLDTLRSMITYLAQFSISSDHDARSRSAAASCLFSVLFYSTRQGDECNGDVEIFRKVLEEVVRQTLTHGMTCLEKDLNDITPRASGSIVETSFVDVRSSFSRVEDALNFLGLLVSHLSHTPTPYDTFFADQYIHLSAVSLLGRVRQQHATEALFLKQQTRLLLS